VQNLVTVCHSVYANIGGPQFWRSTEALPLGIGIVYDRITPSLVVRYEPAYGDPPEKNRRSAFQGHSKSWELARIDRLPMTSYWWSIVYNYGHISYCFRDKRRFHRISRILLFSCINAHADGGFLWNVVTAIGSKNCGWCLPPDGIKFCRYVHSFRYTTWRTDRGTRRQK